MTNATTPDNDRVSPSGFRRGVVPKGFPNVDAAVQLRDSGGDGRSVIFARERSSIVHSRDAAMSRYDTTETRERRV